ncbi:MAG TPA: YciI family protein [Nonomuraea sp.]|nr:YciI family protein [Nonomuraea sp.]
MEKYLLAVQSDESAPSPPDAELRERMVRTDQVTAEMRAAGSWVFAGGLLPSYASTVVRPGNGTSTMTDGPFAGTNEQLGGFWVVQCEDLDQALAWAEKCALACGAPIEVRPFRDGPPGSAVVFVRSPSWPGAR